MTWIVAGLIAGVGAFFADYVMWGKVFTGPEMHGFGTMPPTPDEGKGCALHEPEAAPRVRLHEGGRKEEGSPRHTLEGQEGLQIERILGMTAMRLAAAVLCGAMMVGSCSDPSGPKKFGTYVPKPSFD